MAKSSEAPVEMKFFGFGAGQSTYYGKMESDKIVEFYKRELPRARLAARGDHAQRRRHVGL